MTAFDSRHLAQKAPPAYAQLTGRSGAGRPPGRKLSPALLRMLESHSEPAPEPQEPPEQPLSTAAANLAEAFLSLGQAATALGQAAAACGHAATALSQATAAQAGSAAPLPVNSGDIAEEQPLLAAQSHPPANLREDAPNAPPLWEEPSPRWERPSPLWEKNPPTPPSLWEKTPSPPVWETIPLWDQPRLKAGTGRARPQSAPSRPTPVSAKPLPLRVALPPPAQVDAGAITPRFIRAKFFE